MRWQGGKGDEDKKMDGEGEIGWSKNECVKQVQ